MLRAHGWWVALFLAPAAAGQEGSDRTQTQEHRERNDPGRPDVDDARMNNDSLMPRDMKNAIPMPELDPANDRLLPDGFVRGAVSLDRITGEQTVVDLVQGPLNPEQWIVGSLMASDVEEAQYQSRSWNADLTQINSIAYPWSTQCRIYFDSTGGLTYVCSGTMIDPKNLITAGHCVHEGFGGNWYTNFRIYPAWDGDSDAYGSSGWSSAASFTDWTVGGSYDGDMGFIRLSRPVGFLTGWLGYGYNNTDSFFTGNLFNMAGYPASCYSGAPHQLYYGYGSYDTVSSTQLHADVYWSCDTGGVSGSSSYWIDGSGNRYVYANHSNRLYGGNPDVIGQTRMTSGKYDYFQNTFLPGGYSQTDPDYTPLDVNITTSRGLTAGEQLASMNYLVANASMYNPIGTQNYPVDVYLSTNDFISTFDTLIQSHSFNWNFDQRSSVRVTVTSPPTIPADTPSGNYWVGVIVHGPGDLNSGNDNTSGWDSAPLTVTGCEVNFTKFGVGHAGSGRFVPDLAGTNHACQASGHQVVITKGLGAARGQFWGSLGTVDHYPFFDGHFYIDFSKYWFFFPIALKGARGVPGDGSLTMQGVDVTGNQGTTVYTQVLIFDSGASKGLAMSNGLQVDVTY